MRFDSFTQPAGGVEPGFAGTLPDDIKFRDCQFAGAFVTQVNLQIVDLLTDQECDRIQQLVVSRIDHDVIDELEKSATLPAGVFALANNLREDEIYGTQPEDALPP